MSVNPAPSKDPNTAMIIEILAGYFGFLGIGYLYAGRIAGGLLRLFGWWVLIAVWLFGSMTISAFSMSDAGTLSGLVMMLCLIPVVLVMPVVSGLMLKHSMRQST